MTSEPSQGWEESAPTGEQRGRSLTKRTERPGIDTESELTRTVIFDLLADERRRHVMECLRQYDTPIALADVADEVAVMETGSRVTEIPAETIKRVYLSLYHVHVPKLADANVVSYQQERDVVSVAERADDLAPYLESASEEPR